jgi:ribonucleoside-diphosphate reductase alpha chain
MEGAGMDLAVQQKARSLADLSDNTLEVLKRRYLLRDEEQNVIETPGELFRRVAHGVSWAEENFKSNYRRAEVEERFYEMMVNMEFLPNSPTLMNAGTEMGQLSACFVMPVEDSMEGIFGSLGSMARIHQSGGGTGFNFSKLRPKGDVVYSTKGNASGPVSFMSVFDQATGVIVQGGRRRGANMGILRCDHPDIVEFAEAKCQAGAFRNFNISVGITDKFIRAVKKSDDFELINPRNGEVKETINARELFEKIVTAAHRSGDPGLVFLDEINKYNPTPELGEIEATNPCGELPLLSYESCNLGSINLSKMVSNGEVDWDKLKERVQWGVRFLDDVVEINNYPLEKIREKTIGNRKIGLGVMGFADMLVELGIAYNSTKAVSFAKKLMSFIHSESIFASQELAKERGVFANYDKSIHSGRRLRLRNATVNTIAPTGTISIIAGCSSGIEPIFAVSFVRNVLDGRKLFEINNLFETVMKDRGLYSEDILNAVAREGSLRNISGIPDDIKRLFVTAFDVKADEHLAIQAAFQKYTDNAVSKTINLPSDTTVEDVRDIFLLAYKLKCKGITVYRYGCKDEQVLELRGRFEEKNAEMVTAGAEYSGGCVSGECVF